jgi:hypothetical protein
MDRSRKKSFLLLGLALMVLLACNLPGVATPTPEGASAIYTAAAQTVIAQVTQVNQPPATPSALVPTFAPPTPLPPTVVVPTNTAPPPTAVPPTNTAPPPTSVPLPCDAVKFIKDVSVPDNTEFAPGTKFTKIWRLRNIGTCTWTTAYHVVFTGGDGLGAPASVALPNNVAPGDAVDVSVPMIAPDKAGTYRGDWKLRNAAGGVFGLGDNGNKPFWVQIKVVVQTGITYDFLIKAKDAEWISSVGAGPGTPVQFNGSDEDVNGTAKIKDAVILETGATSGKILLTYPRRENNGAISGLFPAYTVQSGDFLKAKLGFMLPSGSCHSGKVRFQIMYKEGGSPKLLQEWTKTCTGNFIDVNLDLSSLKGKTVQFGFVVQAEGAPENDWAIWNSPRIEH